MKQKWVVSRFTFALTVFTVLIVITIGEVVLVLAISRRLGFGHDPVRFVFGGLGFVNFLLARVMTDRLFKAIGLSLSGSMVEGRRPTSRLTESLPAEDVVEIRPAHALSNTLALLCLGFTALIFVISEIIVPRRQQTGRESLPLLYGMFLGLAALGYLLRYFRILRIDDAGVTAPGDPLAIGQKTILWSGIASCDLVVIRDTFGKVSAAYPVMKDAGGKDLFRGLAANLITASPKDQQRVLQILKRRFPKLDLDPWEL